MKDEIIEMRLCEQAIVILKPNILYKFTVDPDCRACYNLEKKGKIPTKRVLPVREDLTLDDPTSVPGNENVIEQ